MNNEPAFPSHGSMGEVTHEGMTLRDAFAFSALPCVIAIAQAQDWAKLSAGWREGVAQECYAYADAMLLYREVQK